MTERAESGRDGSEHEGSDREEKDPPVPADIEGRKPKKVHDAPVTKAEESARE